ncbi:MAG: branched-chain amino acid transport system substrate-binding protein [Variibacter sp.]|jgi:branched-chain amino acid transport system substrate-binding protein|nr:branched-chain amino acid transport system substrate-binding protein [Variibacter sp.]
MRRIWISAAFAALSLAAPAQAEMNGVLRIAVLNDQSTVYADYQGRGSVLAAQMAVEDYAKAGGKRKVEVVTADHQNKPDVGAAIGRRWVEQEGVDVIMDLPNSAVALAVSEIVKDRNKVMIGSGAGSSLLTGAKCSPNTVHWTYDTWSYGHSMARAVMAQGLKNWFFITADYAFGHDLEKQAADEVTASGGKVVGIVRHPLGNSDFASFLVQAQSSGAEVVAFANAGGDLSNSLKQAAEFGLSPKQKLVGLIFGVTNVPGLGLKATQGIQSVAPFYWDQTEGTRGWSKRFQERHHSKMMPNDMHAGVYAAALHYLKAVDKVNGPDDGRAVVAAMKEIPSDDPLFGKGTIREDGRKLHPMYLYEVKKPEESKHDWDYFKVVATIDPDKAFRPLKEGGCSLVK